MINCPFCNGQHEPEDLQLDGMRFFECEQAPRTPIIINLESYKQNDESTNHTGKHCRGGDHGDRDEASNDARAARQDAE